jgi:hypothetical protein
MQRGALQSSKGRSRSESDGWVRQRVDLSKVAPINDRSLYKIEQLETDFEHAVAGMSAVGSRRKIRETKI